MIGIIVAIAAQVGLYLGLRQISTVTMPAWAHHHHAGPPLLPWPTLVPVTVVKTGAPAVITAPALPAPTLSLPPPIAEQPLPNLRLQPSGR